jgi:peptide deformylase
MNENTALAEIEQIPITDELALKNADRSKAENESPEMKEIATAKNIRKLVLYPDPILKKECKKVEKFDSSLKSIIDEMLSIMRESGGIGLAAPQIGISDRFFVCNISGKPEDDMIFINPKLELSGKLVSGVEKCLSIPGVSVECKRYPKAKVTYKDLNGNEMVQEFTGKMAIVIQHEYEHTIGRTITDRMNLTDQVINKRQLDRLKKIAQLEKEKQEGLRKKAEQERRIK